MSETTADQTSTLQPVHVTLLVVLTITLGACFLLLSAARSIELVDGAVPWHEESLLRAIVQTLCLGYRFPTIHAGDVKVYFFAVGTGFAALVLTIATAVRGHAAEAVIEAGSPEDETAPPTLIREGQTVHRAPLIAAQLLLTLLVLWSFAGSRWSAAADVTIGGSILLAGFVIWALVLGNGFNARAACIAGRIIIGLTTLTALIAIAYYYGRNPNIRAKFPFGNPTFLSAALIPGILLTLAWVREQFGGSRRTRLLRLLPGVAAGLASVGAQIWAFRLADSRGAMVGLGAGLVAMWFFAARGRRKIAPFVLAVLAAVAGCMYYADAANSPSSTGRGATLRLRSYAWSYAWRMFMEQPVTGNGQGAFALRGDAFVVEDVLDDPLVFGGRIAHAHNEWLEVPADLGLVGLGLVVLGLALTLRAGSLRIPGLTSPAQRWTLLALMGALVGLTVEEAFGVGLRVSGVAPLFYSMIGLIWAMSRGRGAGWTCHLSATAPRRACTAVIGVFVSLALIAISHRDWTAALNAHSAAEAMRQGKHEEAVHLASISTGRLSATRMLANRFRLVEAHLRTAQDFQMRAIDRQRRAFESEPPNLRLVAIAAEDCFLSNAHCQEGSRALKELIARSPGYINSGRLEYYLNLTRARNADTLPRLYAVLGRGDSETGAATDEFAERDRSIQNASRAIEREMQRQPFSPEITLDYLRAVAPTLSFTEIIGHLARPLRHNRLGPAYVEFLSELARDDRFPLAMDQVVADSERSLSDPKTVDEPVAASESWMPERLRLAAAVRFTTGNYAGARVLLEDAARAYAALSGSAPFGAACCHAELADCRFFDRPDEPEVAIHSAERAITLTPSSWVGRDFRAYVRRRMIEYLLAGDHETEAMRLLGESAPEGVTQEDAARELGVRYRRLCESLLARRDVSGKRKPLDELLPSLRRWADRSLALNERDYLAHRLAADLAFHGRDDDATARHVRRAIELGLSVADAVQFLLMAREQRPLTGESAALWEALSGETEPASGDSDGNRSDGRSYPNGPSNGR